MKKITKWINFSQNTLKIWLSCSNKLIHKIKSILQKEVHKKLKEESLALTQGCKIKHKQKLSIRLDYNLNADQIILTSETWTKKTVNKIIDPILLLQFRAVHSFGMDGLLNKMKQLLSWRAGWRQWNCE